MSVLMRLVDGLPVSDANIAEDLSEICWRVHAHCDEECPVFKRNGGKVLNPNNLPYEKNRGCDAFKSGLKMLEFLRKSKA